ncbi:MAG: type II secretion system protein [Planctomycetota bacterium]|jgi:prepilin-type N-terminal cleavage/methylation domain-containing protein
MRYKGFTLIELMVVIGIISLLMTLLTPAIQYAQRLARRAACVANLRSIGQATAIYAQMSSGQMPRIDRDYTDPEEPITAACPTNQDLDSEDGSWESLGENAMQNVWLMVADDLIMPESFRCPGDRNYESLRSSAGAAGDDVPKRFGWYSADNFSYGMHWPYSGDGDRVNPVPLSDNLAPTMALFADQNPGGSVGKEDGDYRPSNHPKLGTAFLMSSISVSFHESLEDSACGKDYDDIYTVQDADGGNSGAGGVPRSDWDTYICLPEQQ